MGSAAGTQQGQEAATRTLQKKKKTWAEKAEAIKAQKIEQEHHVDLPLAVATALAFKGQLRGWGRCPALLPACSRLARSPSASTGNNSGPQKPPRQAQHRSAKAAREGRRPLSAFVSASPALPRLQEARELTKPPFSSCPASQSQPCRQVCQVPGLLKRQVQGENSAMSKLKVAVHRMRWARQ